MQSGLPLTRNRRLLSLISCLASCLIVSQVSLAQRPYAVVQVSSVERIQAIATELDQMGVETGFEEPLKMALSAFGSLIDSARPCGAVIVPNAQAADLVFFVPVASPQSIASLLESMGASAEPIRDGVLRVSFGRDFYVLTLGSWCYIAGDPSSFASLSSAQPDWIELDSEQDLRIDARMANIPTAMRLAALDRIASWFTVGSLEQVQTRLIPEVSFQRIAALETIRALGESERVRIGITLDPERNLVVESQFEGPLVNRTFNSDSGFSRCHLPGAAASGSYRTRLSEDQIAWIQQWSLRARKAFAADVETAQIADSGDNQVVTRVVRDLSRTVESLATRGDLDLGFVARGDTLAYGIRVAQAETVFNDLIELIRQVEQIGGPIADVTELKINSGIEAYTFTLPSDLVGAEGEGWERVSAALIDQTLWVASGTEASSILAEIASSVVEDVGPIHGRFTFSDAGNKSTAVTVSSVRQGNGIAVKTMLPKALLLTAGRMVPLDETFRPDE